MSSLAGALDDPHPFETSRSYDVAMNSPRSRSPQKEEHDLPRDRDEEMTDLFGQDNEAEDRKPEDQSPSPDPSGRESDRLPSPEREHRQALEYGEEEFPPDIAVEVKEAEVSFPNLPVPRSSDGDNWVVRIPNFIKVDSKPFHPDTYMGPEHEDEESQQATNLREKSMSIKLKVENTVRWRWVKDENGIDRRQSNSRIIRWSDGTLSLRLGNELFDINKSVDTSAAVARQSLGSTQSQSQFTPSQSESQSRLPLKSQGLTYLVAQHKRSQVLQAEAVITGYMTLRPTGMQSETHRMLVRAVGQKHNKVARLRMAPDPTRDPEREKQELMKTSAKKSKKKMDMDDGLGGGKKKRFRRTADRDLWSDDDDEGGAFHGSEEEEEDGSRPSGTPRKSKKRVSVDDGKKGPEDYQEDDFVVADSSEEESGSRPGRKKREEVEEDPLDKLESKIREQESKEKRKAKASGSTSKDDEDDETEEDRDQAMDVESEEEDEEEFKVRRPGGASGTRKRPAVHIEEED